LPDFSFWTFAFIQNELEVRRSYSLKNVRRKVRFFDEGTE
jgi:hypothetical protein